MISFITNAHILSQFLRITWFLTTLASSLKDSTIIKSHFRDFLKCLSTMRNSLKYSLTMSSCLKTNTCLRIFKRSKEFMMKDSVFYSNSKIELMDLERVRLINDIEIGSAHLNKTLLSCRNSAIKKFSTLTSLKACLIFNLVEL